MGVAHLWKALEKGEAVSHLDGSRPGEHGQILAQVENTAVAVDLSAWLMQATTQPALMANFDTPFACVVKVVFDRTIHWLRHGVLPIFVIEGDTPLEKLERLRQRAAAAGGLRTAGSTGSRAGSQFDQYGQAARKLAEAMGVPCVQAVGEAEATCAALNVAGWAAAAHTSDVDALLFGAQTVHRSMHLQMDDPRKSQLSSCKLSSIQTLLGIREGGHQALLAVAQLAGGDYDVAGAERVGDTLAIAAVKALLQGQQDDRQLLEALQRALVAGADPELDALAKCTGCRQCGHEGGRKNAVKAHTAANPCQTCLEQYGALPEGAWCWAGAASGPGGCSCRFHTSVEQRQLNRVVGRAARTPGFMANCRSALAAYQQQTTDALAAVTGQYGVAAPGAVNVFTWRHRPDVRAVADIMMRYLPGWDYRLVRCRLLPLLLEWDARQGATPAPQAGVQLRLSGIKKVVTAAGRGGPAAWSYLVRVDRVGCGAAAAAAGRGSGAAGDDDDAPGTQGAGGGASGVAQGGWREAPPAGPVWRHPLALPPGATPEQEDVAIDVAWLSGQGKGWASSSAAGPCSSGGGASATTPAGRRASSGVATAGPTSGLSGGDDGEAAEAGGGAGRLLWGTCKPEHRYLRCSVVEQCWPQLAEAWRERAAGARGSGSARQGHPTPASSQRRATTPAWLQQQQQQQPTMKDYFSAVKGWRGGLTKAGGASAGALGAAAPAAGVPSLLVVAAAGAAAGRGASALELQDRLGLGAASAAVPVGGAAARAVPAAGEGEAAGLVDTHRLAPTTKGRPPGLPADVSSSTKPGAVGGASGSGQRARPPPPQQQQQQQRRRASLPFGLEDREHAAAGCMQGQAQPQRPRAPAGAASSAAPAPGSSALQQQRPRPWHHAWMDSYLQVLAEDSDSTGDVPSGWGVPAAAAAPGAADDEAAAAAVVVDTEGLRRDILAAARRARTQLAAAAARGAPAAPPPSAAVAQPSAPSSPSCDPRSAAQRAAALGSVPRGDVAPLRQRLQQLRGAGGPDTQAAPQPRSAAAGGSGVARPAASPLDPECEGSPAKRGRLEQQQGEQQQQQQQLGSPLRCADSAAAGGALEEQYADMAAAAAAATNDGEVLRLHRQQQQQQPWSAAAGCAGSQHPVRQLFQKMPATEQQQQQRCSAQAPGSGRVQQQRSHRQQQRQEHCDDRGLQRVRLMTSSRQEVVDLTQEE